MARKKSTRASSGCTPIAPRCGGAWWTLACCCGSLTARPIGAPSLFRLLKIVDPVPHGPVAAALDTVQAAATVVKLDAAAGRAAEKLAGLGGRRGAHGARADKQAWRKLS